MTTRTRITSGVGQLDELLGGLFIGDNVVWHDDAGSLAWVYGLNFLEASRAEKKPIIYVCFDRSPKTLLDKLGRLADRADLTIIDCFTDGKGDSSPVFEKYYENPSPADAVQVIRVPKPQDMMQVQKTLYAVHATKSGNVRLVFETLTGMQELWGGEDQVIRFYSHACPRLYELETIAYWIMEKKVHSTRFKAQIAQIAQVVIDLSIKRGTTSLAILKADNREVCLQTPYVYWTKGPHIVFDQERRNAGGLNIGYRIRNLRTKKGLSQTDLARLVGVTPSTISQVEHNLIYPSLPALIKMAEILKVEVSAFLEGSLGSASGPVFSARDASPVRLATLPSESISARRLIPIDFKGKVEPYLLEIRPRTNLSAHFMSHKGEEIGYLISGKLELRMDKQIWSLGPGDLVYLTHEQLSGWKNPGSDPASLLWFTIY